jgi:hypothetical protein
MTEQQALEDAKAAVARNCAGCDAPDLDDADLEYVVRSARVASFWTANTYVRFGALVCATSDGTRYRVSQAGTTGATEPAWSTGAAFVDGDAVLEPAVSQIGLYDISKASAAGWQLKAGKAAAMTATSSAGQSAQLNQVRVSCMQMAASFQQQGVA